MPPTLADRLHHVLHAIENIEQFLGGKGQEDFAADQLVRMAVERSLEIVSEASADSGGGESARGADCVAAHGGLGQFSPPRLSRPEFGHSLAHRERGSASAESIRREDHAGRARLILAELTDGWELDREARQSRCRQRFLRTPLHDR